MFGLTSLDLSRMQFAFTISVHILFPTISVGLASFLAAVEFRWLRTKSQVYRDLYLFLVKIFAVTFGMGVVSGLVMAYEFGTNWGMFSRFAGNITGPLLTYEVLTAFFLEAGFLGVMLFGWSRVGPGLHFFATSMVALGTLVSTTWILASNSWLQTPAGYAIVDGRAVPTDWLKVIFNPSFPFRLLHMSTGSFLATSLFVAAIGAWHILRKKDNAVARKMLSMAMWMLLFAAPLQAFLGDAHGLNTLEHQPAKIAAIEGHWENVDKQGQPLVLFAIPDMEREANRYEIALPRIGGLVLTHDWNGQIRGLKEFPKQDRPNATIVFFTFRIMVGLGLAMIGLGFWGLFQRLRQSLFKSTWLLRATVAMGPSGLIAVLAGWYTTEIGRQPWTVYGVLRTADAVSPHPVAPLAFALGVFVVVYLLVFGTGISYVLRLISAGPHRGEDASAVRQPVQISAVDHPIAAFAPAATRLYSNHNE